MFIKHNEAILKLQKLEKLSIGNIFRIPSKVLENLENLKYLKFSIYKRFCENILNDCTFNNLEILKINDN